MRSSSLRTLPRRRCASAVSSTRCRSSSSRWLDVLDGLAGERLFAEVQLGNLRFRPQDAPPRRLGAAEAVGQLLAAFGDGAGALLPAFLDLPQPGVEVAQPLLALGQLDFGLGGFAAARLPLPFEARRSAPSSRPGRFPSRPSAASSRRALLAGLGQPAQRRFMLLLGGAELALQHAPLLVELGPPLFGGRESAVAARPRRPAPGGVRPSRRPICSSCSAICSWRPAMAALALLDLALQLVQLRSSGREAGCGGRSGRRPAAAARRSACRRPPAVRPPG